MVGHTFLYNNGIQELKRIIDSGEIGSPLYIHLRRTNLGPIRQDVDVVYDLASHDIYIANYLLNSQPEHVVATGAEYLQSGLDDVAFITLRYPSTVLAHIHVSWLDPKKVRQMSIVGSKKMSTWDDLDISSPVAIYDKGANTNNEYNVIPRIKLNEPLANQTEHFLDCVINRTKPLSSGESGLAVVQVLQEIQRSIVQNR